VIDSGLTRDRDARIGDATTLANRLVGAQSRSFARALPAGSPYRFPPLDQDAASSLAEPPTKSAPRRGDDEVEIFARTGPLHSELVALRSRKRESQK
jgi:hypothetical protein